MTGGIVCDITLVEVEAMHLRRTIKPWGSQYLMFEQKRKEVPMETKKNQLFFLNGENSVTKIKEREGLRRKCSSLSSAREIKQDKGKRCPLSCTVRSQSLLYTFLVGSANPMIPSQELNLEWS